MPNHFEVSQFISSLIPPRANDVPLFFHIPWNGAYDFSKAPVEQVVLSVTPTLNVYEAIYARENGADDRKNGEKPCPPQTIAFLHRPFTVDCRRLRNNVLVLASHTSFDENLTVGWNPALAQRLGMDTSGMLCVKGYKGDPDRRLGAIAKTSMILGPLLQSIEDEFGAIEYAQEGLSEEIHVFAMTNAFSANEVHRVLDMAQEQNWVPSTEQLGRHVLCLTGQPSQSGLTAAKEKGMTVVCVGARVAEQWGIGYMGNRLRAAFPDLKVKEIYEDELPKEALKH
jgi:putative NIF3 family GTP cyclohydrolase 1 type 2